MAHLDHPNINLLDVIQEIFIRAHTHPADLWDPLATFVGEHSDGNVDEEITNLYHISPVINPKRWFFPPKVSEKQCESLRNECSVSDIQCVEDEVGAHFAASMDKSLELNSLVGYIHGSNMFTEDEPQHHIIQQKLTSTLDTPQFQGIRPSCRICPLRSGFQRKDEPAQCLKHEHVLERKFICAVCHFQFKRKGHLTSHVKAVHEKSESFLCCFCSKLFASNSSMRKHVRVVHKMKNYK